ncbi:MAG: hypothetical protein JWO50_758 [Candidatus Kaiserbacteria bacterium]|nr:hypothetical protein [Candidatus Kaiserbacteria bacterium]
MLESEFWEYTYRMDRDQIRSAIASDLRGKAYMDRYDQKRALAEKLGISEDDILNQVHQMMDLGHVISLNDYEIRLSIDGERFYFSGKTEKTSEFFKKNWPHITSNVIAILALLISILLKG